MRIKILFFIFCFVSLFAFSQEKMIPVVVDGDEVTYLKEEGRVVATGSPQSRFRNA